MKKLIILCLMAMSSVLYAADAGNVDAVRKSVMSTFTNLPIDDIRESEIGGLYEIESGNNIIYTDGRYLMMGHLFDFSGKDITQEKINGLTAKKAGELDKTAAVRIGHGKKEVIEFTDPECPYCIKAEEFFKGADVSRYVYFFPLSFHKNAERLSVHILCSSDPATEYRKVIDAVSAGKADSYLTSSCDAGREKLKSMQEAGKKLGVRGTPFFVIDGKAVSGADPVIQQMIK